jgi:hypothetical protein
MEYTANLVEAKLLLVQALVKLDPLWDAALIQQIESFLADLERNHK